MLKHSLVLALLFILLNAGAQDHRPAIYQAYLLEEMDTWKEIMKQMETETRESADADLLYNLLEAEYGYTAWLVADKRKKEAAIYLEKASKHMALLIEQGHGDARVYAMKGAFHGFNVMLEPIKAPSLGKMAMEASERAMELDPNEAQVWLEKANMDYYRPAIFGGSKRRAVPLYVKAVRLFESNPESTRENWLYMNCLAGMAIAYEKTGKKEEAGEVYRKILSLEPSFKWVKEELYPQFREKHPRK